MAIRRHIMRCFKQLCLGSVAFCAIAATAFAQNSPEALPTKTQIDARKLAQDILRLETEQPVSDTDSESTRPISLAQRKAELRKSFYFAMTRSDLSGLKSIADEYEALTDQNNLAETDILKLYRNYIDLFEPTQPQANYDQKMDLFDQFISHDEWYIAFQAYILRCMTETHARKPYEALENANAAINLIPNELTPEARAARIQITDIVAYLHNLQNNTELAVENTARLVEMRAESGQAIKGTELLNNLMYSFGNWRDHETRLFLAEILLQIEDDANNDTPGLTELRIAQVNSEIGEFEKSLEFATIALQKTSIAALQRSAKFQQAIAHAGLGHVDEARAILDVIDTSSPNDQSYLIYANALLAMAEGRDLDSVRAFNRRMDMSVQRLLTINNQDTTSLLAALENTRERQIEREKSLLREAELREQKIRAQQRVMALLSIISAFLLVGLILAIRFARYRDKVSKELKIKSEQAEDADRMKTEFLGMISHELRTPLNGIIGIADFLTHHNKDPDVRHKSGIILKSGNTLFRLLEAIIDMSRIDGGKLQLFPETGSLKDVLQNTAARWEDKAKQKGLTYTYFIADTLDVSAEFDEMRLTQCLDTLLSNAIKFTDQGRVHMHITGEQTEDNTVALHAIVADTGMGIREDIKPKMFRPFLQADSSITRKHNGSGLRLAIARSLAHMMQGDVTMVSNHGRGSEFAFTAKLPIVAVSQDITPPASIISDAPIAADASAAITASETLTQAEDVFDLMEPIDDIGHQGLHRPETTAELVTQASPNITQRPITNPEDLRGLKVLIVEDLVSNQDIIKLLLAPQGIECLTADSGVDALEILQTEKIDIILMDIRMPGMTGVDTIKVIRESGTQNQATPIIVLTADVEAETNVNCMQAGADIFLTKPVIRRELIDAIIFLRRREAQKVA